MKKLVSSLAFLFLFSASIFAAPAKKPPIQERPGETVVYTVKMNGLSLGTAKYTFAGKVDLGGRQVNLSLFETKVTAFYDLEKIYSDPKTYLPVRIERTVRKPASSESLVEEYDQKKFTLVVNKIAGKKKERFNFNKKSPIQNAILLPFSVRRLAQLESGWAMEAQLPQQQFKIKLAGIETVRVPAGSFECYHFTSEPARFDIWITKDESRIPVKIRGSSGFGYTLLMKEYK